MTYRLYGAFMCFSFLLFLSILSNRSPSASVVKENATMLFCHEASVWCTIKMLTYSCGMGGG